MRVNSPGPEPALGLGAGAAACGCAGALKIEATGGALGASALELAKGEFPG
jgi:hypothetical protein